jgi:hypothetical protein
VLDRDRERGGSSLGDVTVPAADSDSSSPQAVARRQRTRKMRRAGTYSFPQDRSSAEDVPGRSRSVRRRPTYPP